MFEHTVCNVGNTTFSNLLKREDKLFVLCHSFSSQISRLEEVKYKTLLWYSNPCHFCWILIFFWVGALLMAFMFVLNFSS